jgi:hypothetical protein
MAGFVIAAAVGLRDERIEAEKQAEAEHGWGVVDGVTEGNSTDGGGTEAAYHNGVDDGLEHPTDFTQDDGKSEHNHGAQFPSPVWREVV